MDKNQLIAVTGMTGVGKDFIVDRANREHGMTVVNWGTLLGEELAADRDEMMDTTPPERIRQGQFTVCRNILSLQPALVTCHAIRPNNEGQYVYDLEIERMLNPSCYIFVAAPPELIYQRVRERNQKGERRSAEISVDEIDTVQQIKLDTLEELSRVMDFDMLVLNNVEDELDQNVKMLGQRIGGLSLSTSEIS